MAHLNCLPPRATGVNDWFFLLAHLVVGVGIKQKAKCEMQLCKIDGKNEHAKLWIFREISKWRRWRHAPRLMATSIVTNSRHRFSIKNIVGDDQTTLMVHRNSAISRVPSVFTSVYICAITTVVPQLTVAAVATHPHCRISKRWHVVDVKNVTGDDQATLTVDRNSGI